MNGSEIDEEAREAIRQSLCRLSRVAREEAARLADIAPVSAESLTAASEAFLFGLPDPDEPHRRHRRA